MMNIRLQMDLAFHAPRMNVGQIGMFPGECFIWCRAVQRASRCSVLHVNNMMQTFWPQKFWQAAGVHYHTCLLQHHTIQMLRDAVLLGRVVDGEFLCRPRCGQMVCKSFRHVFATAIRMHHLDAYAMVSFHLRLKLFVLLKDL